MIARLALLACAAAISAGAAAREWTAYPLLTPAMGGERQRGAAVLRPQHLEAASVLVYAPGGAADRRKREYAVGPEGARIEPAAPQMGNYHWVLARQESPAEVRVASTVWYFSNPGEAPRAMLAEPKHELEIVPEPLPREHGSYRESEKWRFLVRLNGAPLPGQPLILETEFGSRSTVVSDAAGYATVLFPRDFRPAPSARTGGHDGHGPRRARFVLAAETEVSGRRYLTAFNHNYGPDAERGRSLGWGVLFGVLGMAAATPLLRRRPDQGNGDDHA